MDDLMAVVAPTNSTSTADRAHVPHKPEEGETHVNGNGKKRAGSPHDGHGAAKKAKTAKPAVPAAGKKRKVVESSDEAGSEDAEMEDVDHDEIAQPPKPINPDAQGHVHIDNNVPHPHGIPPTIDQGGSSSDEDTPLSQALTEPKKPRSNTKPKSMASKDAKPVSKKAWKAQAAKSESDDSEEDKPLAKKVTSKRPSARQSKASKAKEVDSGIESDDASDDDEEYQSDTTRSTKRSKAAPKAKKQNGSKATSKVKAESKPAKTTKKTKATAKKEESESEEDEKPLAKGKKGKVKDEKVKSAAMLKKEAEKQAEDEALYKWWEANGEDDSVKWTTLEHNGVLFPPPYDPLPKNIKMKYDGVALTLVPEAEEVAGFFAALTGTEHAEDATFRSNFFQDWQEILKKNPPAEGIKVKDLEKCDFSPIFEYLELQKEKKKQVTAAEKKALKAEKDEFEQPYLWATIDGRKEKIGNFRVEPPGLFRGRGEHPKKGKFKYRLDPSDIIINIGKDAPVPVPNIPGKWKEVQHDNKVTWLAHWKENVNGNAKYVFLSAASTWKGQSDRQKFEKARKLQEYVDVIRKDYTADLKSKVMADRQRATAMYLIDRLALRAGNEKGEEEADTVGCCSLRLEHITLIPPSTIELRFLGKDSIMYEQEVEVDPQVFKNMKIFKAEPKTAEDDLFDRLTTGILNKHLGSYMEGLTAKVFRTYNASYTFQQQLKALTPKKGTVSEKIAAYNKANKEVAILCNHQKTVGRNHGSAMMKLNDKIRAIKYERMRWRYTLFTLDPALKKKHKDMVDLESDIDEEFFDRHETSTLEQNLEKAKKKFEKENTALEGKDEKAQAQSVLDERLKTIKEDSKQMIKERKTKKIEAKGRTSSEAAILTNIKKLDEKIETQKISMEDRESNKTVALGTSKINYIDPRLTVAWAKKYEVPLEKLFTKALITKFPWAIAEIESEPDWSF